MRRSVTRRRPRDGHRPRPGPARPSEPRTPPHSHLSRRCRPVLGRSRALACHDPLLCRIARRSVAGSWARRGSATSCSRAVPVVSNPPAPEALQPAGLDPERICSAIAQFYGADRATLSRLYDPHLARAVAAWLCRRHTQAPRRGLAERLGLSRADSVPSLKRRLEARLTENTTPAARRDGTDHGPGPGTDRRGASSRTLAATRRSPRWQRERSANNAN
jgi:hypothetical protein